MKKILVIIGLIIFFIFFLRFVIGDHEDSWICEKPPASAGGSGEAQWVKHGKPSYPKPIVSCGKTTLLPRNKEDCLKTGGVWKKQGPEPFETCNRKAKDRGNLCRDNSECEGTCQVNLTKEELTLGMRGKPIKNKNIGQCSVWIVELGCFGMMNKGKAQVICID